jgi:glyoxylase-like metal-dependent hydrolase (beta-lactamase superfamily II)
MCSYHTSGSGALAMPRAQPHTRQKGQHPVQLAPALHQIGSNVVNCYLIEEAGQVTIVDAGLPGQWRELLRELSRTGRSLDDVRAVLLTHGDTDHIGFAARLHRERGIPIYVHASDAARARREVNKSMSGWGPVKLGPLAGFLIYSAPRGGLRVPPVTEPVTIQAGSTLDVPGSPRVIAMPGHTPGSVAYHVPAVDAVFVGDAMTTRSVLTGAVGPRPAPFTLDPDQANASIERLADIDARWVLPGHGPAWSGGTAQALSRYRAVAAEARSAEPAR